MKARIYLIGVIVIFCLFYFSGNSQDNTGHGEENGCGTEEHHKYMMKNSASYKESYLQNKTRLDSLKRLPSATHRQLPEVYTIPIVVHLIHLGEPIGTRTNITDDQILDAIAGLNDRYANQNGMGANIEIKFCLANRDPNGCPTSGIVRVDGSGVPGYAEEGIAYSGNCGANEEQIKDLSKWPVSDYYNIWVVHDICGDIAGYAYYPNGNPYDGTVIDVPSMTYNSRTLAHELGHGLNLQHTFSGENENECPDNFDCLEDGDEICDTPPHRRTDCGLNNPCMGSGEWDNSRYNWMSYCATEVQLGRFTEDQSMRMRDALIIEPRASLLLSQGCANEVSMQFTSDNSIMCEGESRVLTAMPEGGEFILLSGSGVIEGNLLTATDNGILVIAYVITSEACSSSVYQEISVKATPNSLLQITDDSLCMGESTTMKGIPSGGYYTIMSGPGLIDINQLIAQDTGIIEVLYEVFVVGCWISDMHVVLSNEPPTVEIEQLTESALIAVSDTGVYQWLLCDNGNELIPGATNAIYEVPASGSYAVVVTAGGCSDTSDCVSIELTSVYDHDDMHNVLVYPNPVNDLLHFESVLFNKNVVVTLFDMLGHEVNAPVDFLQSKLVVDVSKLMSGVYVVKVEIEGEDAMVYRVVKN